MVPLPPSGAQHRVSTWSKLLLSLTMLGFITACTLLGVVLAPHITVLGVFLNTRAVLQYIFANLNNRRMITATGRDIINGILNYMQDLDEAQVASLNALVGKKLTIDKFMDRIHGILGMPGYEPNFWRKVAFSTIDVLRKAGKAVEMVIDINVPIYHMKVDEYLAVLDALKKQILSPRVIWLVINGDDLPGEPIRAVTRRFIREQRREAMALYAAGSISKETRDFLMNRWRVIDLDEGDKRGAMTAAWLASFGVAIEDLPMFVKQLFDDPDHAIGLKNASSHISLNVDSDTIAHPLASFITYLAFIEFDLAGLTSNVRISNISDKLDRTIPFRAALEKWFLSWLNYFKYDYANNVERAAQSYFFCVVCMSGPWMAVMTSLIPSFLGRFVNYRLRGVRIKPGDDRKVTYELNMRKKRTAYHPWVVTYTDAPDYVERYCEIQDRWTMSMYANFFTSLLEGQIWLLHIWSIIDQMYAAGFTFLVLTVLGRLGLHVGYVALTVGIGAIGSIILPYLVVFLTINLVRGFYAVWDNDGDWRGMLNSLYFILVIRYLIPIKIDRLLIKGITPKTYKWAGR